jgi:hypothetical protein
MLRFDGIALAVPSKTELAEVEVLDEQLCQPINELALLRFPLGLKSVQVGECHLPVWLRLPDQSHVIPPFIA